MRGMREASSTRNFQLRREGTPATVGMLGFTSTSVTLALVSSASLAACSFAARSRSWASLRIFSASRLFNSPALRASSMAFCSALRFSAAAASSGFRSFALDALVVLDFLRKKRINRLSGIEPLVKFIFRFREIALRRFHKGVKFQVHVLHVVAHIALHGLGQQAIL